MEKQTIEQALATAIKCHVAGNLRDAEAMYRKVLAIEPDHADALNLLGVCENQFGRREIAIELLQRACERKPDAPHYECNLANALAAAGKIDAALEAFGRSIAIAPGFAEAHYNLAGLLQSLGRLDEAETAYRRAIELRPGLLEASLNLGSMLKQGGNPAAAMAVYETARVMHPASGELQLNLANALAAMGKPEEALAAYRRALELNPNLPEVMTCLAALLHKCGDLSAAAAMYEQALTFAPRNADAISNLANTLNVMNRVDEAEALCRRALEMRPDLATGWLNLGNALGARGELYGAIEAFAKAESINPAFMAASSNRLYMSHFRSDYTAADLLALHQQWGERYAGPLRSTILPLAPRQRGKRPLRIGYLSPDFGQHPVGRFMLPVVERHDRRNVEVYCYAHVSNPDQTTHAFREKANQWRDIAAMTDEQAAQAIRADGIDILVDLAMHAASNRLLIFARKPSPVQATYLAYCATTGIDAIDFRITDPYLDPPGTERDYVERSIRLPNCYWCYSASAAAPEVVTPPSERAGVVTFGSLNNVSKLTDATLSLWGNVLRALPSSRMLIHVHEGSYRRRITELFHAEGIAAERIEYVGRGDLLAYYSTFNRIDVALDTTPYAGGTTTCDALWMGVPVVTLRGHTAVGRGGVSICSNLGLQELIADDATQYVAIAVEMASKFERRRQLRASLRQRMLQSPLMDIERFVTDLETVYREMWEA